MGKEIQKVNAGSQRQRYSKEFKLTAVKLQQAGQKPATQFALELGIRCNLLYKRAETLSQHAGNTETVSRALDATNSGITAIPSKPRTQSSNVNWHVSPKSETS
jgi:transposase-like protein